MTCILFPSLFELNSFKSHTCPSLFETLSYSFDRSLLSKIGLQGARVYTSALNLYTFHKVNFWDPERGVDGLGKGIYPVTKTFMVGLDITL